MVDDGGGGKKEEWGDLTVRLLLGSEGKSKCTGGLDVDHRL